jgi:hypothetical protein
MRKYTNRERKIIIDKINQLSQTEHQEIFKLISDHHEDIAFTQNCNGIFINFRSIHNDVVSKIDDFVTFCLENKIKLDEYDQRINECKINNKIDLIITKGTPVQNQELMQRSQPLNIIIHKNAYKENHDTEWLTSLRECKQKEKLDNIIDILESNTIKVTKKKTCNMKFSNAKKKFARKVIADKKYDMDLMSCLEPDLYKFEKTRSILKPIPTL